MNLITKLIIGIIIGTLIGLFAPEPIVWVALGIREIINQFIGFIVPLIIIFFIATGISNLKGNSGKTLGTTVGLSYLSSITAGIGAALVGLVLLPNLITNSFTGIQEFSEIAQILPITITPITDVMTALALAFTFGIGMTVLKAEVLQTGFQQGKKIVELCIHKIIIPLLPLYVLGVFTEFTGQEAGLSIFKALGIVLVLVIGLHWLWLISLYCVVGWVTSRNPFRALKKMLPSYLTGVGTMSSAATIPVTLRQVQKNNVSASVANFTIPLFAMIHLAGSMISLTTCTIAVIIVTGDTQLLSLSALLPFIFTLALVMIAAPGVPGGAIMSALGILGSMLGFDSIALGLIVALYLTQDSFGTACNVTSDGALTMLIDHYTDTDTSTGATETEYEPASTID